MIRAVIIDDVPEAISSLKDDIAHYCPEIEIVGTAQSVISGAKLLKTLSFDVLFLDIHLQDGTGFDLLEIYPELNAKIIFTTASDAFAIKAFRYAAIDYLMKPIDPDELVEAVKKLKSQSNSTQNQPVALLLETIKAQQSPQRLALHTLEKIHIAEINEIVRCESSGNYTIFYFQDKSKLLVTKTLKEFDNLLAEKGFIRVHQSHLVNCQHIKEFLKLDGGYLVVSDGAQVPVSVRKKSMVLKVLEQL